MDCCLLASGLIVETSYACVPPVYYAHGMLGQYDIYFSNCSHCSFSFTHLSCLYMEVIDASYLIQVCISGRPKHTKRTLSNFLWTFFNFHIGLLNSFLSVHASHKLQFVSIEIYVILLCHLYTYVIFIWHFIICPNAKQAQVHEDPVFRM